MSELTEEKREAIAPVLGRLPSGVYIVTASDGAGNTTGMLTSWVQQASFEPPVITIAVNNKRYINDWIEANPQLAVSIVAESQTNLFGHFGKGFEPGEPAFEGLETIHGETGLPILQDALGYLEGRVIERVNAGDHTIVFLEVTAAGTGPRLENEKPYVHIRKNGFSY